MTSESAARKSTELLYLARMTEPFAEAVERRSAQAYAICRTTSEQHYEGAMYERRRAKSRSSQEFRREWRCARDALKRWLVIPAEGGCQRLQVRAESAPDAEEGLDFLRHLSSPKDSSMGCRCGHKTFHSPRWRARAYFLPGMRGRGNECRFRHARTANNSTDLSGEWSGLPSTAQSCARYR